MTITCNCFLPMSCFSLHFALLPSGHRSNISNSPGLVVVNLFAKTTTQKLWGLATRWTGASALGILFDFNPWLFGSSRGCSVVHVFVVWLGGCGCFTGSAVGGGGVDVGGVPALIWFPFTCLMIWINLFSFFDMVLLTKKWSCTFWEW